MSDRPQAMQIRPLTRRLSSDPGDCELVQIASRLTLDPAENRLGSR
jgi:hypothetical protein